MEMYKVELVDIKYDKNENLGGVKAAHRLDNFEAQVKMRICGKEFEAFASHNEDRESAAIYAIERVINRELGIDLRAEGWTRNTRENDGTAEVMLDQREDGEVSRYSGRASYDGKDWKAFIDAYVIAINEMINDKIESGDLEERVA